MFGGWAGGRTITPCRGGGEGGVREVGGRWGKHVGGLGARERSQIKRVGVPGALKKKESVTEDP